MAARPPHPLPEYCCAILRDRAGRLLLERRPPSAAHAPGMLTCFGGARDADEAPAECIARELLEELGLAGVRLTRRVRLVSADREIAWFYGGVIAASISLRTEPGHAAVWVDRDALAAAPLSAWHRAAIGAALARRSIARVSS